MGAAPRTINSLLLGVTSALGLGSDLSLGRLLRDWPNVVGRELSAAAKIESLEGGKLVLVTEKAVWNFELSLRRGRIKELVNGYFKEEKVKEVHVKLRRPNAR